MRARKILIESPNFEDFTSKSITPPWEPSGVWPCKWIWIEETSDEPVVVAFRKS